MKIITNPPDRRWEQLAQRPALRQEKLMKTVKKIFSEIRKKGDKAVLKYSTKFDYPSQTAFPVEKEIIDKSSDALSERLKRSIDLAKRNIEIFHHTQWEEIRKVETIPGVVCWRESRPIEKVGIYVPGGSAPLFSTVLMLAIPAKIAGCKEIILCTPPNGYGEIHPAILYTANLTGVTRVFAVGGIQAIGAMTFGTESIPKVDKIFGPGNQYVMAAKMVASLYGTAIDMPAGPSEVLVIADGSAIPEYAGSVFLGNYSCESAGDYASGTNHTLPTNGYAKAYSGVSLDSFIKKITFQQLSEDGIMRIGPAIEVMAATEQHKAS